MQRNIRALLRQGQFWNQMSLLRPATKSFVTVGNAGEGQSDFKMNSKEKKTEKVSGSSILNIDNAVKHCTNEVKKFDVNAYMAGQFMPASTRPYYYGAHALFLEALKSREISREASICQTRLHWWEQSIKDVIEGKGKGPKEPVTVVLKEAKDKTYMNMSLL